MQAISNAHLTADPGHLNRVHPSPTECTVPWTASDDRPAVFGGCQKDQQSLEGVCEECASGPPTSEITLPLDTCV